MGSGPQYHGIIENNREASKSILEALGEERKTKSELKEIAVEHYRSDRHEMLAGKKILMMEKSYLIAEKEGGRYAITPKGEDAYE